MSNRRKFLSTLVAAICGSALGGTAQASKPFHRTTTKGSVKWKSGHSAGCVFYAPDNICIADPRFDADYIPSYVKCRGGHLQIVSSQIIKGNTESILAQIPKCEVVIHLKAGK